MRSFPAIVLTLLPIAAQCQVQVPALPGAQAISPEDRIYTGDQSSNTVTVIAPSTNEVLGTNSLGDPRLTDNLRCELLCTVIIFHNLPSLTMC